MTSDGTPEHVSGKTRYSLSGGVEAEDVIACVMATFIGYQYIWRAVNGCGTCRRGCFRANDGRNMRPRDNDFHDCGD